MAGRVKLYFCILVVGLLSACETAAAPRKDVAKADGSIEKLADEIIAEMPSMTFPEIQNCRDSRDFVLSVVPKKPKNDMMAFIKKLNGVVWERALNEKLVENSNLSGSNSQGGFALILEDETMSAKAKSDYALGVYDKCHEQISKALHRLAEKNK